MSLARKIAAVCVLAVLGGILWYAATDGVPLGGALESLIEGPCPGPCPQPSPLPSPRPLNPSPTPFPSPTPTPLPNQKIASLLVIYAEEEHSRKLKSEYPRDLQVPTEWRKNTQQLSNQYRIQGTPTILALDARGGEIKRQLGYLPADELRRWAK